MLTEGDGELLIININHIPKLKGSVDLCGLLLVRQRHLVIVLLYALGGGTAQTLGSEYEYLSDNTLPCL